MSGSQGETKSSSSVPQLPQLPQLTQQQTRALARGRTIGHYGRRVQPKFTLRQRVMFGEERNDDIGGSALYKARTKGVLRGIHEVGFNKTQNAPVIRAIGRQNLAHSLHPLLAGASHIGMTGFTAETPPGPSRHIMGLAGEKTPVSDLTKTLLGAKSKRKGKSRKNPRHQGGRHRRTKRKRKRTRKTRRKRKRKTRRKTK